jgi:hypothetical protein
VTTPQGEFSFVVGDLALGAEALFLGGAAAVRRTPAATRLTQTETDDDFPAAAVAPDGSAWCVYTSYDRGTPIDGPAVQKGKFDSLVPKGNGDQIKLMHFAGGRWSAPIDVLKGRFDVWRPSVAVDGKGVVWVFWSQQFAGNWDVYCRSYVPAKKSWGAVRRLTVTPGTDAYVVATACPGEEGVWIAWQGWRSAEAAGGNRGNFDILLARVQAGKEAKEQRISTSGASDWHPTIAAGPNGDVWVAWDTYDKGSYDVFARRVSAGKPGAPVPIATGPRFQARPSVAVDAKGRAWIAFEDADANWGKDYGSRLVGKGVPFYLERNILVRCVQGGKVLHSGCCLGGIRWPARPASAG